MSKFIEEFYYGNIDPQARSTKQNKTVQKQMEVLMLNEEFLTEALTGENKKKFLEFPMLGVSSTENQISIALLWDFDWEQTLHTILSYQPKRRLRIY